MQKFILTIFAIALTLILSTSSASAQEYDWVYVGMVEYPLNRDVGRIVPIDDIDFMYKVVYLGSFEVQTDAQGWKVAVCRSRRCMMTVFTYTPNPISGNATRGSILPQSAHRLQYDAFPVQSYGYAPRTIAYGIEGFMTDKTTMYFFIVPLGIFFGVMIARSIVSVVQQNTSGAFADVSTMQKKTSTNSGIALTSGLDDDHDGAD